jgi:hypothetical protein
MVLLWETTRINFNSSIELEESVSMLLFATDQHLSRWISQEVRGQYGAYDNHDTECKRRDSTPNLPLCDE